jgi:hypothetical protein
MFYDPSMFPFLSILEDSWQRIYNEYLNIRNHLVEWHEKDLYQGGWKIFALFSLPDGEAIEEGVRQCPFTSSLIKRCIPNHRAAGFTVLQPMTRIKPHEGNPGDFLRCHLGLQVPIGDCKFRVSGETRPWAAGKVLVFDDRCTHEVWNLTSEERVVFVVDFIPDRPERFRVQARDNLPPERLQWLPGEDTFLCETGVPPNPVELSHVAWRDGVGSGFTNDPYMVFSVGSPRYVSAIRFRFAYENTPGPATLQVFWRSSSNAMFTEEERNITRKLATDDGEKTVTIFIRDLIDEFRIDPDIKPCTFRISDLQLLTQAPERLAAASPVIGSLDLVVDGQVSGWAWNRNEPDETIQVDIFDSDNLVDTVSAGEYREDLRADGMGDGRHSFVCPLPARLRDGQVHVIGAKIAGTAFHLLQSPRTVVLTRG